MKITCLLLLTFVALFFSNCSKLNEVSVSSRNFEEVIDQAQNLVFTFDKDLVTDSDLNSWTSNSYLEFSPAMNGKFKWTAKNELVFSPANEFSSATNYKVKITKALLTKAPKKLSLTSNNTFDFHTPYLQIVNSEGFWDKNRNENKAVAKLKLIFNYPVNAAEVAKLLSVTNDEKAVNFTLNQTPSAAVVLLNLNDLTGEQAQQISVVIKEGLKMIGSNYVSKEAIKFSTEMPSTELHVLDIKTGFENNKGYINIKTSTEIKPENLSKYYEITNTKGVDNQEVIEEFDTLGKPILNNKKAVKRVPKIDNLKEELTENGFIIHGEFNETDTYVLTIKKGLMNVLGKTLQDDFTKDLFFGEMPANINFANKKATYLSSKGSKNIGVNIVNIPKVQVKIAQIYENNILQYMKQNRNATNGESEEGNSPTTSFDYQEDTQESFSNVLVDKKVETQNLPKVHGVSVLNMNIPNESNRRGIYLVSVNADDKYYQRTSQIVSISDIGLICKQADDEMMVVANSIEKAEAMPNVEITLISSNNQSIISEKTDADGVVIFKNLKEKLGNFKVAMITAKTNEDFNYLLFDGSQVETSRYEVEGKHGNTTGFDAFVYGDRNIYRPGETIYFNTVIRKENWESVGEIPIKIKVLMPNGKELASFRKETNDQGASETSFTLDKAAVTGTYSIEIYNGNDVLLTSQNISIEEFMPDRIKVDVKTNKEFYKTGEPIALSATALNLFGPPATDRNYEVSYHLSRKGFMPKFYKNYTFDVSSSAKFNEDVRQGKTDQQGGVSESFMVPTTYQDMGVLEAKMYVTVFDESSRPVNRVKRVDIFTQPIFYGIGMNDHYLQTNSPSKIPLVALNKDEKPVNATAEVEIVKFDYQTVIEKQGSNLKYSSKKQTKIVYHRSINFSNGLASITYVPAVSGEYEIRVYRAGANSWTAQNFYAYGFGNTENSSFEVNNEGKVEIEFDKEKYQIGDHAKVLFKTPFVGKLLVTVEKNKIIEHYFINTDKKSAELSLNIQETFLPNCYISATLIRPMNGSSLPLTVAHGYAPMVVEKPSARMPVEIVAVEKSRSNTKQKITVKTGKSNAEVTLAVVDEGILQLKNFDTPAIFDYFYQKQALEVNSYDIYPFLFPEISIAGSSSTGGDMAKALEKRVNPLSNGRVKLVAFWSGILKTNGNGEASFEVNIPQFSGDLRVMAVAYKNDAFGSATKNIKVADPIVISTALPRFLSPNDEITVPVNLTNTTKQIANVTVSAALAGNLTLVGNNTQTLSIAPEKEVRTQFFVKANSAMGNGSVTITANGLKEKFTDKTEITIRPPASLLKTSSSGVVAAGQNTLVNFANDYIPSSISSQLIVSKSPSVEFVKFYQDLLGYPYGCLEQTTSKAFPQLYFADFVKQIQQAKKPMMGSNAESDLNPTTNVQNAIKRLESMQTYNGGLSMWQAGEQDYWWGTAYACHFLLEAQKAEYQINGAFLGKILEYLTNQTNRQGMTEKEVWFNEDGSRTVHEIAKREMIYSLYVLSMAGKSNRSAMNYYKSKLDLLSQDERFMLAAAFSVLGDVKSFNQILPKNYSTDRSERSTSESLSSPIRNMALALNTLIDTDPNNLQVPTLARQLSMTLKTAPYLSTQESAFVFLALGKLAKKTNQTNITASIVSNGKNIGNFTGTDLIFTKNIGNQVAISTKGNGNLYYFSQTEGLSATGKYVEEDQVLQVRRQFFSRDGQAIRGNFKQNQLIVVKITLQSLNGLPINNVVITDMLPAGLEIENPRISPERELEWIKKQSTPEHFDMRDDRINYFTSADKTPKTFYYLVRAVSKGKYILGPVSADAMYNGDFRSYNGGGTCVVE